MINDKAYEKYVIEDGHTKALRKRHNQKARNIEKRFKKAMGYEFGYIDDKGTEHGYVNRGQGRVPLRIPKKGMETVEINHPAFQTKQVKKQLTNGPYYTPFMSKNGDPNGEMALSRKTIRMKGSDLIGGHEYTHFADNKAAGVGEVDPSKLSKDEVLLAANANNTKLEDYAAKSGMKEIARQAVKNTGLKPNGHDDDELEVHADADSISTIPGNNNANRFRKTLNRMAQRITQSQMDRNPFDSNFYGVDLNDPNVKRSINEANKKRVETAVEYNRLKNKSNNSK